MTGRVLGLDPGERRIGVALSDPLGIIAQPHCVIDSRRQNVAGELLRIVAEEDVTTIVIGLPISLDGKEHSAARRARDFADRVKEITGLEPRFADERFTTAVAEDALIEGGVRRDKRRLMRDKVAAAVMLQRYLDHEGADHEGAGDDVS
jgi:putative Holliday junction resolvase